MITKFLHLVARWWRKPVPPRIECATREYVVGERGLEPVFTAADDGEVLLTRAEAERFLDDMCMDDWRVRCGEVLPAVRVGGEWRYSQRDLEAWVTGTEDFHIVDAERTTRA